MLPGALLHPYIPRHRRTPLDGPRPTTPREHGIYERIASRSGVAPGAGAKSTAPSRVVIPARLGLPRSW